MYHIANGTAVVEYLLTLYWKPSWKTYPYLTPLGKCLLSALTFPLNPVALLGVLLVIVGQILRSTAMIHASTNFSHTVAFNKRATHQLVTDGIYA